MTPRTQIVRENQHLPLANSGSTTAEARLLKTIAVGGSTRDIPCAIIKSY